MAGSNDRVTIELVDVGNRKNLVVQVLSKVKGLAMPPEEIVNSTPCTIAENIPLPVAEKLQDFLKKAGATLNLVGGEEPEEDLFSPDEFPLTEETFEVEIEMEPSEEADATFEIEMEPSEETDATFELEMEPVEDADEAVEDVAEIASDEWVFDDSSPDSEELTPEDLAGPSDDFGGFSAVDTSSLPDTEEDEDFFTEEDEELLEDETEEEQKAPGKLQQFFSGISERVKLPKKEKSESEEPSEKPAKKFSLPTLPKLGKSTTEEEELSEESEPKKPFKIPFFTKKSKPDVEEETELVSAMDEEPEEAEKKKLSMTLGLLLPAIVGFLIGVVIAGAWGWATISSTRREAERDRQQIASQIQGKSEQLVAKSQQQAQQIDTLNQENAELLEQIKALQSQPETSGSPTDIVPSPMPDEGKTPLMNALISSFEKLKNVHTKSLEQSYDTQQKAACSQQVLLDGEGTLTNAQVVKKFSSKFTTFDIMRSDSLVTPYIAELKIPFQQEFRAGDTEKACNAAKLQQFPSPKHHEFGTYYGYWTVQYVYKDGKWQVKSTVIERNRALYEKSFKVGSPDYAKFLVDYKLFPEFQNQ